MISFYLILCAYIAYPACRLSCPKNVNCNPISLEMAFCILFHCSWRFHIFHLRFRTKVRPHLNYTLIFSTLSIHHWYPFDWVSLAAYKVYEIKFDKFTRKLLYTYWGIFFYPFCINDWNLLHIYRHWSSIRNKRTDRK